MTVSTTQNRVSYAGNGVTVAFSFPYVFFDDADLVVLKVLSDGSFTKAVLGTDYTVAGAGVDAGGTVTMAAAPASGTTLVVYRDPQLTQPQAFVDNDPLPAKSVSRGYDRLTVIAQRIRELVDRSFRLSDADTTGASPVLPTPTANAFIGWNALGNGLVNRTITDLITVSAYGTAVPDKFVGDGTKKDFTLTANPGALANMDVSIEGITQQPGRDFFWDGDKKLSFNSAPPAPVSAGDTNVYVRYLRALPQGSADAAATTWVDIDGKTGDVQTALQVLMREVNSLARFGAKGDGVTDDTAAIQKALDHGGIVHAGAGTYLHGTLNFVGRSVLLVGDGEDKTVFKANASGIMFDAREATDQVLLPLALRDIRLDGAGLATGGVHTRYRHKTEFVNVTIANINGDALNEIDSWNNIRRNLTLSNSVNGLVLQGADNNATYDGLSVSGHSQYQMKILNGGTVAGGSTSPTFNVCDIEYAPGYGVYVNTHGVVRFNDCYIGEQIQGTVFDMAAGMVVVSGGFAYFGTQASSYLGYLGGGKLLFKNVNITGASFATQGNMFTSGAGRACIEDCPCYLTVSGVQVMNGDCLDYGRAYDTFAPRLGRNYTPFTLNGTHTYNNNNNGVTITCATVTGSPCIIEVSAPVRPDWMLGQVGCIIVVYRSIKPLDVRLTNGQVGITPATNIATLPATAGALKTAIVSSWVYDHNDVTVLEIFQQGAVPGDNFTISEVFLYDFKTAKSDAAATFYNLGKC